MNAFTDAGTFLIQSLATVYLVIILLRFLLQLSRADFYNPVSQFAHKATMLFLAPLRKAIPTWRNVDLPCIVLALAVQWLAIQIILLLHGVGFYNPLALLAWGAIGILSMTINFYLYGLLAAIILSWVAPHNPHPAIRLLWQLMEPVMAPFRKVIPSFGGIDLSPIFIFLVLKMFGIFIIHAAQATGLPFGAVPGI